MDGPWRLHGSHCDYELRADALAQHDPKRRRVAPIFVTSRIDAWLNDPLVRRTLLDVYYSLEGRWLSFSNDADLRERVRRVIEEALDRGWLFAVEVAQPVHSAAERSSGAEGSATPASRGRQSVPPPAPVTPTPAAIPDTWVELAVQYEDGSAAAGVAYRVVGPDGKVHEGTLDGAGVARLEGIPAGSCQVTLPEVDGREWRTA